MVLQRACGIRTAVQDVVLEHEAVEVAFCEAARPDAMLDDVSQELQV